ncbi:FecR domain-containing protein [Achromobacter xylosoxidans]|uniref:Siderophore-interacting protein n=1 Tax=Alcaligenes xylosoxydans xylosoxydans TaxID=85698 RepID=A0A1R1JR24_ALCXX|nr:FecR domain-containing protein [Achromobacter xylosoxidans]OMG83667.1 siderophore-interacting protein [Achromobacter xylosoxidans]BEG78522.1 Protein FecR [Achromobacter xylosoxidans]
MADKTIAAAAQWYARLCADDVSAADVAAHGRWLAADPEHARIWRQVERLRGTLGAAPARLAADTLSRADQHFSGRRAALRNGLGAVALLGAGSLAAWRALPMERMLADYRTGAGERRELRLADGTLLWLDSASAVDVTVDASQRRIFVHAGEILVDTENARPGLPPLRVVTAHGAVRPLGTRFLVTRQDDLTRVAVLRHAVALEPAAGGAPLILRAGEQGTLTPSGARAMGAIAGEPDAWTRGLLVVDNWRLDDFVARLDRYRPGMLRCDDAVAALRLSGAYPVDDTDQALAAVARALPVDISRFTRYYVRIVARR